MKTKFILVALCLVTSVTSPIQAQSDNTLFFGLGPVFNDAAFGLAQIGADFELTKTESVKFTVGPMLGLGFARSLFVADLNGFIRGAHRFQVTPTFTIDFYIKLPVGLSVGSFAKLAVMGFNLGLIPGVEFNFHKNFGIFADLGFIHHSLFGLSKEIQDVSGHWPSGIFSLGMVLKI